MTTRKPCPGYTLVEMLVVAAIIVVAAAISVPYLKAYSAESHLLGSARQFKARFRQAHSEAVRRNVNTAIRFERAGSRWRYSIYVDGDFDGVQSADIASGRDPRVAGPFPLDSAAEGVRIGINPGVPAPPPDSGTLDPDSDPIRFGPAHMVSFSPLGTATSGTFYLAGEVRQAAVRVTGGTARVRIMVCRGRKWVEQS
jgi:prepilin-type N-terminal cleavage/methylation domain-containing protein